MSAPLSISLYFVNATRQLRFRRPRFSLSLSLSLSLHLPFSDSVEIPHLRRIIPNQPIREVLKLGRFAVEFCHFPPIVHAPKRQRFLPSEGGFVGP